MMADSFLKSHFKRLLKQAYDDLLNDRCELNDEQIRTIMSVIGHRALSKDEVCSEVLHWSRSKFDEYVLNGLMPKGRKRRGWKELTWYEDELLKAKEKIK